MCAFRSGSESQCRPGGGGPIWPTFGDAPGDERKSRINDGVASAPVRSTSARSAGSCGGFCGDWKWGQNPDCDIICAVTIPESLLESARLDGASEFRIYWQILLPNCKAVLATIGLYSAVYNWNDYYLGVIYIRNKTLQPLQTILYKLLAETTMSSQQQAAMVALGGQTSASTIKFAAMVVATLPILFIYPFIQKYLVKGVMIGSIKG